MKLISRILLGIFALSIVTSCSLLKNMSANGTQNGLSTGLALLQLYSAIKQAQNQNTAAATPVVNTNTLDLGNMGNLLNILQLFSGANSLQNATPAYTNQFSNGLISGSSNLVNNNNVGSILSGLMALNNVNSSAFSNAAQTAATQTKASDASSAVTVNTQDKNVTETMSLLSTLFGALGK